MEKQKLNKFTQGKKYVLLEDYKDKIYGLIKEGSILVAKYPNLGFAKFDYKGMNIAIEPKKAFKIFRELNSEVRNSSQP